MDYQAMKSLILAREDCQPHVVTSDMPKDPDYLVKDKAIAGILNADSSVLIDLTSKAIKRGDFLRVLGPITGASIFHKLKTSTLEPLQYIIAELEGGGLQVGSNQELADFLALLVAQDVVTEAETNAIASIFQEKRIVSGADVSIALRGV